MSTLSRRLLVDKEASIESLRDLERACGQKPSCRASKLPILVRGMVDHLKHLLIAPYRK